MHSAEDWDELLLPEIERQQAEGKQVTFRADAAFAKPGIYEALEERGLKYAIRARPILLATLPVVAHAAPSRRRYLINYTAKWG